MPGDANDGVEVRTILDGKMLLDMVRLFPSKFIKGFDASFRAHAALLFKVCLFLRVHRFERTPQPHRTVRKCRGLRAEMAFLYGMQRQTLCESAQSVASGSRHPSRSQTVLRMPLCMWYRRQQLPLPS